MICTLWTPFQAERTEKINTEGLYKFHSNIYSILFADSDGISTDISTDL